MAASRLYGVIWRWHFFAGVVACPIVFMIALTGALYVFQPELDPVFEPELVVVEPAPSRVPVDRVMAEAKTRCTPLGVVLPSRADRAAVVYCTDERQVHVDPYRGHVLGERGRHDGVFGTILGLHWELLLGVPGRIAIEWASSCTLLLLLSGAVLWWPRGKRRGAGTWWPRRSLSGRQWLRDLHAVFGAHALPVLFAITATGLMWTLLAGERRWHPLTEDVVHETWDHPPASKVVSDTKVIGFDAALAAARLQPGGDVAIYAAPPGSEKGSYAFLAYDDRFESPSRAWSVWIDAYSGAELVRLGWEDRSVFGKLDSAGYSIHVGALLGWPGRIAACLCALVLAALCITGPWMWWKRRPAGRFGAPPPPERTPWVLLVVTAVLGWLLPTIGISLIAILLVEGAVWWWRSRSSATTPP